MGTRLELQTKLEELLGSRNVYYQPPSTVKMAYPAIVYNRADFTFRHANDEKYLIKKRYSIIVISKKPDDPVLDKLLALPFCSYETQYTSDNLIHDTFSLYF